MSRLILCVLLALLLVAPAHAADKMRIVASFSILGDMARQVAGDDAELVVLVGPNGDAHIFEPLPADAEKLAGARVLLVNGLGLDNWTDRLVAASGYKGPVVTVSKGVEPRTMVGDSGSNQVVADPHAWQDLANGVVYVSNIVDALSAADPANAGRYRAAGDRYIEPCGRSMAMCAGGSRKSRPPSAGSSPAMMLSVISAGPMAWSSSLRKE